ncbi:YecA family protein [Robertmurraya massiliosenegalensis]|uniref:YecA family protein n=1 Tax=Robertmurraya massiliosenegalensis TaxID=1287657 RepID=UPI0002EF2A8E|nr:SEC-C domain-containing protein [Robertmurraya massiliosenegalensis]
MMIGRNEPCPCGSGKKYKQCCLKKGKVVELGQAKQEHFFQMKQRLSGRLAEEVIGSYSLLDYQSLMKEFRERTGVRDLMDGYGHHWLMFFYRHSVFDGLRGIEWYNRKHGKRDDPALQRLAKVWETLVPRLIQHVDFDEQGVLVEDLFTHERFHMPYCETLLEPQPWAGAFCLLEERDGGYYMNGVAVIVGPEKLKKAEEFLKNHLKETGNSYEKSAFDLYPEMTGALIRNEERLDRKECEWTHTSLVYSIGDVNEVMTAIHQTGNLEMEEWDGNRGNGSLIKKRYRYDDNLAEGSVYMYEMEGLLEINGDQLIYQSIDQASVAKFKGLLMDLPQAVLMKEEKIIKKAPAGIQVSSFGMGLEKGVPPVFGAFAQQALHTLELHLPLPQFNDKTPAEMVSLGKQVELEQWLRELEYQSYVNTRSQTKEKWTADFNSVRKALNLPFSPFTTLREQRKTAITLMENPVNNEDNWTQEELELWDEMGMPVQEIKSEYARDLLLFFQEKGAGRSPNTYYKYRLGVQVLSFFFEEEEIRHMTGILPEHWEKLISYYYLEYNRDATDNQAKGFMTVVKNFAAWLDKRYGTAYASVVKGHLKEMDMLVFQAIMILEAYTPYRERRYETSRNIGEFRRIIKNGELPGHLVKGCFRIKSVTSSYVNLVKVDEDGEVFKTTVRKDVLPLMSSGMVICGALTKKSNWKLYSVEKVFPK